MKISVLFFSVTLLMACGGKTETNTTQATNTAAVANLSTTESSSPGAGQCLLTYQTKMDEALPLATIKKYYTGDMGKAELEYSKSEKYAEHDTYKYEWPTGTTTTREVMGMKVNTPDVYTIGLMWIEEVSEKYHPDAKAYFRQMYHTPTPDELKRAKEYMDKQLDKKMAEKGLSGTAQKAGKATAGTLMNRKIEFDPVAGLGDAASWDVPASELHVLKGRTMFRIMANVCPDKAANLDLAKKLAASVLARCP
jgi:hypothetical protein